MPLLIPSSESGPLPGGWRLFVILLSTLWLLAGVLGHDPWKPDDAIHIDVAWNMVNAPWPTWLVPRLAGEPWMAAPPLYPWLAALCGQLFGNLLPWHDAARLASPLIAAALLVLLAASAKRLSGHATALVAPLLAIGTLGFLIPLHDAQPMIIALVGFALSLYGLIRWLERPIPGGLLLGMGIGISFLGTGLDGIVIPASSSLFVLLHPAWRRQGNRITTLALLVAAAVAFILILPWPWLLARQSPALFDLWWKSEQASIALRGAPTRAHLELLLWASWPLLPLACWNLWLERRRLPQAETWLPLITSSVALLVFCLGAPRPITVLPALLPLLLLAAAGTGKLRRGAANALDWFGVMTFSLLAALIWLGGIAMLSGEPARVAKNFSKPAPGFIAEASVITLVLSITVTVGWIVILLRTPRSPSRPILRWSIGLTTVWVLVAMLWLPWIDYGKSYRSVSADFHRALGGSRDCIARRNLGPAQRASLDYFDGIRTVSGTAARECSYLIVQTTAEAGKDLPGWRLVMQTTRPGDKSERLRLYRRD
ncbi:MAG: hypothetical protein CVU17_03965 [Betaproteobacteria bacterium HGW-Betaproteobacteria-11]|nr:MAG: hypothetical protein CVU17_03965 [Betaproteobacteria bacterium HGW-Betaproteobacteria-11]